MWNITNAHFLHNAIRDVSESIELLVNFRDGHNNDITAFLFLINTTRLWFQFKTVIRQNPLWVTKFHDLHLSMAKLEALLTRLPKIIEKMGDEVLKQRKDGAENRSGMDRAGQNKTGRGKKKDKSGRDEMGRDKTGIRQG